MRECPNGCLQEPFHLADIGLFAVQEFLTENLKLAVLLSQLMEIPDSFYHSFCIALDHQFSDFRGIDAALCLHPDHSVRHKPHGRIQFRKFPSSLAGKGVCFCFDNVIFPQLCVEDIAKWSAHAGFQAAADPDLPHLGGFQNGREKIFAVFHIASPLSVYPGLLMSIREKGTFSGENAYIVSQKGVVRMCGIAGAVGMELRQEDTRRMLATMARRGPDGSGVYQAKDCTLLHSRLAIIDPEGGAQPMILSREDEEFCMVYNGELYNTSELRQELEALGHRFLGHSDTEVLLHAYAAFGEECLEKLNGIYAFAVWEKKRGRLFLARDRIGVKPLFYARKGSGLIFASEIKTVLASGEIAPALDREGAAQLLLMGPGRIPGSGVFHGMYELEPGCCGFWEQGRIRLRRYWKLMDREHTLDFEATSEEVRALVLDAIRRQMVSDMPIGTFLSGGLDSSIITAVCAEEMQRRGSRLMTFSVDYQDNERFFTPGKFQPNADGDYIRLMRQMLNTDHSATVLSHEALAATLEEATIARDLPGMADVDFSLLCFCKQIRSRVKVALSGECADEIFGGYPWYRDPEIRALEGFPWAQNTKQRASLLSEPLCRLDSESFVMDACRTTCRESDILPGTPPEEVRLKEMVNLNFRWFMQTLLDRKDRMSMYHSLEVRVPFCDHRIAEYLYGVPWKYKDWQGREKGLLRHAARGLLPEEVLFRKKSPYPKTFHPAYEKLMEGRLQQLLQDRGSPLLYLLNPASLKVFLEMDTQWPWYGQLMRRPQTIAYLLQLDFWLRHYEVSLLF